MAAKLRNLKLSRIDLVDRPANQLSHAVLRKRAVTFLEAEKAYFAEKAAPVAAGGIPQSLLSSTLASPSADLILALRNILASSYMLYIAAHSAHWNVEGAAFPSWHDFFGEIYEDVFDAIDPFAEAIRQHGAYAPTSFAEMFAGSRETLGGSLVPRLIQLNAEHMTALTQLRSAADAAGDEGLANFCQERLGKHLKYDWQLRAMEK